MPRNGKAHCPPVAYRVWQKLIRGLFVMRVLSAKRLLRPLIHLAPPPTQVHLKDVLTAVISRRKAYRLRDGLFPYAFGSDVMPQPYLKNSVAAYHAVTEW